jgi:hypothetical protein
VAREVVTITFLDPAYEIGTTLFQQRRGCQLGADKARARRTASIATINEFSGAIANLVLAIPRPDA